MWGRSARVIDFLLHLWLIRQMINWASNHHLKLLQKQTQPVNFQSVRVPRHLSLPQTQTWTSDQDLLNLMPLTKGQKLPPLSHQTNLIKRNMMTGFRWDWSWKTKNLKKLQSKIWRVQRSWRWEILPWIDSSLRSLSPWMCLHSSLPPEHRLASMASHPNSQCECREQNF